jgi:hypothetical protein
MSGDKLSRRHTPSRSAQGNFNGILLIIVIIIIIIIIGSTALGGPWPPRKVS